MTAALEGGEWSAARPGRTLHPGKTRYPFYRRLGGPQGPSGRAENLVLTGIRTPDRPARSQSLYRLSYPAHKNVLTHYKFPVTLFVSRRQQTAASVVVQGKFRRRNARQTTINVMQDILNISYFSGCALKQVFICALRKCVRRMAGAAPPSHNPCYWKV